MSSIFAVQIVINSYRACRNQWYHNRKSSDPLTRVSALNNRDRAILLRKNYFKLLEKKS